MDNETGGSMNKSTVGQRIAGSVVGLLAGGLALGGLGGLVAILFFRDPDHPDQSSGFFIILAGLGFFVGAIAGTALGATITQKLLRRRSSFWRTLLGTFLGLLVGCFLSLPVSKVLEHLRVAGWLAGAPIILISMVAGAVIGSGWRAKPATEAQS
jgi:drug/metabolite transporter (DMT)-like permease